MQNVLACIDANRACDRGGCLMGHRDKAMYSSCFKLPFEGGRPPRGEPRPEFGPGSFLTGRGRKIGRCAELRGSETRSHARVQEENISGKQVQRTAVERNGALPEMPALRRLRQPARPGLASATSATAAGSATRSGAVTRFGFCPRRSFKRASKASSFKANVDSASLRLFSSSVQGFSATDFPNSVLRGSASARSIALSAAAIATDRQDS
jgi:hypothetical protein